MRSFYLETIMNTPSFLIKNIFIVDPNKDSPFTSDVLIQKNLIQEISPQIKSEAQYIIDGKDLFLSPGFIDHHCHIYEASDNGLKADSYALPLGCTALCDAGSCGVSNFFNFFNETIIKTNTKIYAYLNVGSSGQISENCPENVSPQAIDDNRICETINKYDCIRGLKLRFDKICTNDISSLLHAKSLSKKLNKPLCVHFSNHPSTLDEICQILDKGDILCHAFNELGESIIDNSGNILKCINKAKEKGIIFDTADGYRNFSFRVIYNCIKQGFLPDIISTDMIRSRTFTPVSYGLNYTMSKYLALGMSLNKIIKATTQTPYKTLNLPSSDPLKSGNLANLCLFKLTSMKNFKIKDSYGEILYLKRIIEPLATIVNGNIAYSNLKLYDRLI